MHPPDSRVRGFLCSRDVGAAISPQMADQRPASTAAATVDSNATPKLALCVSLPPTMSFHTCPHVSPNVIQGVPPATVAEWTLQGDGNLDFYDGAWAVSLQSSTLMDGRD